MPRQMASDLERFFDRDIKHWHRGTLDSDGDLVLSSYKLLELFGAHIDSHPDTGDVDPKSWVVFRDGGVVARRRYGDLAEKGTREICVDFPPIDGAVDLAVREGGFSRMESMIAQTHNQLSWLTKYYVLAHNGKDYEPDQLTDPRIEKQKARDRAAQAEFQREVDEDMFGGIEW